VTKLGLKIVSMYILIALSPAPLVAQSVTIFSQDNKSIQNCRIIALSEVKVRVEYAPFLPGLYISKNLPMDSIDGIQEFNRVNKICSLLHAFWNCQWGKILLEGSLSSL
jgi:hypothetical protein